MDKENTMDKIDKAIDALMEADDSVHDVPGAPGPDLTQAMNRAYSASRRDEVGQDSEESAYVYSFCTAMNQADTALRQAMNSSRLNHLSHDQKERIMDEFTSLEDDVGQFRRAFGG